MSAYSSEVAQLYASYLPRLVGIAQLILGDAADAEDVAQDAFLELWRSREPVVATESPAGKVLSGAARVTVIARSRALDRLRHQRVMRLARPLAARPERDATADASGGQFFCEALALLPERQRVAIELAYGQGLTHEDIALRLGAPLGTVKTRIRAGLRLLALRLEEPPRAQKQPGALRAGAPLRRAAASRR